MRQTLVWLALAASVVLAGGQSSAMAAEPIMIGPGQDASVAVDSAGVAHVAYNDNASSHQVLHYCRLPRGETVCGSPQALTMPGTTTIRPHIFTDGQTVRILAWRYDVGIPFAQDFLITSTDGGRTFSQPVPVGTIEADDAVAGPGAAISIVSAARATSPSYQRVPTDGSAPATTSARLSETFPYKTTVGLLENKTPVVAFSNGQAKPALGYSVFGAGDPNAGASWSTHELGQGDDPQIAGGPVGVFLMAGELDRDGNTSLEVFELGEDGHFPNSGARASFAQAGGIDAAALVQDDTGGLQAIYSAGSSNTQLMHNAAPGNADWGEPSALVKDTTFLRLEAAAGRDHAGLAVWHTGTGTGSAVHATRFATNVKARGPATYDLRAKGIEVTQAVQTQEAGFVGGELPSNFPVASPGGLPVRRFGKVPYKGVHLAAHSKTVARVFADATSDSRTPATKVVSLLRGFRGGKELPGSPLLAETGLRTLTDGGCACVTAQERASAAASYDFTLPLNWTASGNQRLTLRAELRQPAGILTSFAQARPVPKARRAGIAAIRPRECSGCTGNNQFTLADIPFTPTPTVVIAPVHMAISGQPGLPDPAKVFAPALNLHPGGERFMVEPYQGTIDVTKEAGWTESSEACKAYVERKAFGDCKNSTYFARVREWDYKQGGLSDMAIGINKQERGAADRSLFNLPPGNPDLTATPNEVSARPIGLVNVDRPLSSVGHELGHLIGRVHASGACGGNGEDWPPDQVGYVDGIGLDRMTRTGDPGSPYRVVAGKPPVAGNCSGDSPPGCGGTDPLHYFDLMSYCAWEDNEWIAARTWESEIGTLNRFGQRVGFDTRSFPSTPVPYITATLGRATMAVSKHPKPPKRLHVEAFIGSGGAVISSVGPAVRPEPSSARSDYALVVTGGGGTTLSSTPMIDTSTHVEGGGPLRELTADVPFSPVARSISVVTGGAAIATRVRSAHSPTVRVTSPKPHAKVGRKGTVRWVAKDADGDPLTVTVAYSRDAGRTWRTMYSGPDRGRATLPGAYFGASRKARVLVRVNDGFDEAGAVSSLFRARGVRPKVTINSARPPGRILNTSTLVLSGYAFDDGSQPIKGKRLAWFDGRRRIGRGPSLSTDDLSPGRRRIRLVARDHSGRKGSATVKVRVVATKPQLLALSGPKRVGRRTRSVVLKVAVTVRSKLRVNGRSFSVGRRARKVRIPIKRGRRVVRLRLALRAGGRSATFRIAIRRR